MESYHMSSYLFFLFAFSGSAKAIACTSIVLFALATIFIYLSWTAQKPNDPIEKKPEEKPLPTPEKPQGPVEKEIQNEKGAEKHELEEQLRLLKETHENTLTQIDVNQQELQKKILYLQQQASSLQLSSKMLFTAYQNVLKKYEETQKAHLYELKTLFKNIPTASTKEISSLLTFHRHLNSTAEQLYFLLHLINKAEEEKGSDILQSLSALQSRKRLRVLEMYQEIPWIVLNLVSGRIEGSSKSCQKYGLLEKDLATPLSKEPLEKPLQAAQYELFHLDITQTSWTGLLLDNSKSEALLICTSPKMVETLISPFK